MDAKIGLCEDCRNAQVMRSDRGSTFYLCRLHFTDDRFAKYPRLPVVDCDGYQAATDTSPTVL
jgi:hypothetical protein